ncbi:MAG: UDP-N-acetylmuramoyl-L-alanyl-D-glutamate--2,6-diaminopimelate ligase [Clostridia bacterium]|nr:UDP-N-acetylmuramoyl-L-alanyl-D-glutamate--2,6-diaminopimelate ligase [Clostridia bacterium]
MQLRELLKDVKIKKIVGEAAEVEISGVNADSRIIAKGEVFVALVGGDWDGHDYIFEAERRGAAAVVCHRADDSARIPQIIVEDTRLAYAVLSAAFFGNPQEKLKIIGVTGTNGKTTTCHFLASVLKSWGKSVALIGTLGTVYADLELAPDLTTPDPVRLYRSFADMAEKGVEYVVMEVSAHAIYYRKIAPIRFVSCIFTNCTQDHLDFFGTMEKYSSVKKQLFSCENCGVAILNFDDAMGAEIAALCPNHHGYSLQDTADNFAIIQEEKTSGSRITLHLEGVLCKTELKLTGKYNVRNALAAATCAHYLGADAESIERGLQIVEKISGRLESVGGVRGGSVFVDFAHTPDGLKNALQALKTG